MLSFEKHNESGIHLNGHILDTTMANYKDLIRMHSRDHIPDTPFIRQGINLCRLPDGTHCMGCCGMDFAPQLGKQAREAFLQALITSRNQLATYQDRTAYKHRYKPYELHDCGMCRHLVISEQGTQRKLSARKKLDIYCPLHPLQNDGKELRHGECDFAYMCKSQRRFVEHWDDPTREQFLAFITSKQLDWYEYSVGMHTDTLLREFERTQHVEQSDT